MRTIRFTSRGSVLGIWITCAVLSVSAQSLQLVSSPNSALSSLTGGGDSFSPVISRDGRYVLFSSSANNLVTNTDAIAFPPLFPASLNIFLRDRTNSTTSLVSISLDGTDGGNADSFAAGLSTNGQYALFDSSATNLVAGDTNNFSDVFVRDLINKTTTLISVGMDGECANGFSRSSVATPDGRYVAFVSSATNLVSGDTNGIPDVFVRDFQNSITTLISVGARGNAFNSASESPDISADGRYVVFYSTATNLIPGISTSGEIYVRDMLQGTTILASTNAHTISQSIYGTTNCVSYNHTISEDGQFVAYQVSSNSAPSDILRPGVILRYNVLTGATDVVSTNALGSKWGFEADYRNLDMTPDGRFIAFLSNINVALQKNAVCVWDAQSNTTTLASVDINNTVPTNFGCYWPQISDDGRFISFFSSATNLTTNVLVGDYHLYIRDLKNGATALVDARRDGSGAAYTPANVSALSSDGTTIVFDSFDSNLVTNAENGYFDVFVCDLAATVSDQMVHVTIVPPATLTWPIVIGKNYQVEFKNDLSDGEWQVIDGSITFADGQASVSDLAPAPTQRFYRVVAY